MRLRRKQAKPLHINDITIIDDEKLKKPLPRRRWVMRWNGSTLVFTGLLPMHWVKYSSPVPIQVFK